MIRWLFPCLLILSLHAADVTLQPNGDAVLENSLIRLNIGGQPGHSQGIDSWQFKPIGQEMIDVLYGQTDYVEGHVLGERWDTVSQPSLPSGNPDVGRLYIPQAYGHTADGSGALLVQESRGEYALRRTVILRRDLAVVELHYRLTNLSAERKSFALRFHSAWSPGARGKYQSKEENVYIPTTKGVVELDQTLANTEYQEAYGPDVYFTSDWADEPRRVWTRPGRVHDTLDGNWAATISRAHGDGMYFIFDRDPLLGFYNCPGITVEPCLRPIYLDKGQSWEFTVYLGSFTGGKAPVNATPLYLITQPLKVANGHLTGELLPTFQGTLSINGKAYKATPTGTIVIDAPVAGDYTIVALDTNGQRIGSINQDGAISLRPVEIDYEAPERPRLWLSDVYVGEHAKWYRKGMLQKLLADYTVVCPWEATDAEKTVAREIVTKLGLGLAWENVGGKLIVVGSARTILVSDIGQLKYSVDTDWPGAGKGMIATYDNVALTESPLVLIAGSDPAGTVKAARHFIDHFLFDAEPPTGFRFQAVSTDQKIYPYSRPGAPLDKISVQLARGEYEPAQLVITAFETLDTFKVTMGDLVQTETGKTINMKQAITRHRQLNGPLWLRWVDYFPIDRENGWAGFPDPLFEQAPPTILAGASQPLWLTVFIPEAAAPGHYTSSITAKSGDTEITIPIEVEVWDFVLPRDGLKGEPYMDLQAMPPPFKELKERHVTPLISDLVEHGMRVIHLGAGLFRWHFSPEGAYKGKETDFLTVSDDGTIALDASGFDTMIEWCDRAGKPFDLSYMVYIQHLFGDGYGDFKRAFPKRFNDLPARDGHWYQGYYAEEMLKLYKQHLEKSGMMARTVLKIGDEPPGFNDWYDRFTLAARNVGLPIITCFNSIVWSDVGDRLNAVTTWQPLYMLYNPEFFARARAAGARISWYNCGPPPRTTNGAAASELRGYLWQAAKADLDSVCWWGIQCWGYYDGAAALWKDRYSHWNSVIYPAHPTKKPYVKPGKSWVDNAPIDSIRWEHMRDGMEDAWYVNLLRRRITAARAAGHTAKADDAQAVLDSIWANTFPTLNDYAPPFADIQTSRQALAKAILSLND